MVKKKDDGQRVVADNRRARHSYFIESSLEAGLVLKGSEVKSLRNGKANIQESYASAKDGEIYLVNSYIPEYTEANRLNLERSHRILRSFGFEPIGFAGPHGRWCPHLDDAMEELG